MAPSSLRNRTPRYGDFINGVSLVLMSGGGDFSSDEIIEIYAEMVERADVLETQVNSATRPGEVDDEGKKPYLELSQLIKDYINYKLGIGKVAEWIQKADLGSFKK